MAEASWTEPIGALVGTARYAAPEQAGGAPLDGRADLYALSVVLVEACTGEVPVIADTVIGTLAARTTRGIVAPPELGALGAVIERAGRPDRAERYPDAATMAAALHDVARRLPAPEPLPLAGLGEGAADADPTSIGIRTADHVAVDPDTTRADADLPYAIPVATTPRRRPPLAPFLVGGAILVAFILAAVLLLSGGPGPSVPAPTLVGRTTTAGGSTATNAGVLMKVVERQRADDPAGLIISQSPGPGAFVSKGGDIDVVVSRGPPPVPVPSVVGRSATDAQTLLTQAGFVPVLDHRYDQTVGKGLVISTAPAGATRATPGSAVKVLVSDGPPPVAVPSVASQSFSAASQTLQAKGFSAVAQDAYSNTVPAGEAIGTNPSAGTLAPYGSQIAVEISQGPQPVAVPNVVGQSVEAASEALSAVGLVPDVQNYGPGKPVVSESPAAGTMVQQGSSVTLVLGHG